MHGCVPNLLECYESQNSKTAHCIKPVPIQTHFKFEGRFWLSFNIMVTGLESDHKIPAPHFQNRQPKAFCEYFNASILLSWLGISFV